jgi:hypothetical protein
MTLSVEDLVKYINTKDEAVLVKYWRQNSLINKNNQKQHRMGNNWVPLTIKQKGR